MMERTPVAIVGYGNVGQYAVEAVRRTPDLHLAGIVRRNAADREHIPADIRVVDNVDALGSVHVALLTLPTRHIEATAANYLADGIHTVDSYDIHGELANVRRRLDSVAKRNNAVAMISMGWDPGTNSVVRSLFEMMAPHGITYTNYGPGVSMGHSVAVRAIPGVQDGFSVTVPLGQGLHRRLVYVVLHDDADFAQVKSAILADDYFARDDTHVTQVADTESLIDLGHGVLIERKGGSGHTHNQLFNYEARINNPALTAQIMVSAARAATRQNPGAYTMLDVPPADFLPGTREDNIRRLV